MTARDPHPASLEAARAATDPAARTLEPASGLGERRVPCPSCGAAIWEGAAKCRSCRRWLGDDARRPSRFARSLTLIATAVVAVLAVLVSSRESPVGDAPPLTPMGAGSAALASEVPPEPEHPSLGPERVLRTAEPAAAPVDLGEWRAREIAVDVHPLDVVVGPSGATAYVTADDASLREIDLATGRLLHMASVPAQGDRLRLLHDRYLAVLRHVDAAYVPVLDTKRWDRDPVLLEVGAAPAEIVALADGKTVVCASRDGKRLSWLELGTGRRLDNIRLPHAPSQLYVVRAGDHVYVGAMGVLQQEGQPAGAWLDLFDPSEKPFGATRRSVSVGRDPRAGAVTRDGGAIFFADHVSNAAVLVGVAGATELRSVAVDEGPVGAFLMNDDRFGITLNATARTATVVELASMTRQSTLMLPGVPASGATSPDGRRLFVSLGGTGFPPDGSGAVVIAGDPPRIVAALETGRGASRVAASRDGKSAVVAGYWSRSLTVIAAP
jgi:predicted nucleic acid-binding Zn ribbon protein